MLIIKFSSILIKTSENCFYIVNLYFPCTFSMPSYLTIHLPLLSKISHCLISLLYVSYMTLFYRINIYLYLSIYLAGDIFSLKTLVILVYFLSNCTTKKSLRVTLFSVPISAILYLCRQCPFFGAE